MSNADNDDWVNPSPANRSSDYPIWVDSCKVESHSDCDQYHCEVKNVGAAITDAQIRVGIATAVSGILISTSYALGILAIWLWHSAHGHNMPDIPVVLTTIAMMPFAAGAIVMRIPGKAILKRLTDKNKEETT